MNGENEDEEEEEEKKDKEKEEEEDDDEKEGGKIEKEKEDRGRSLGRGSEGPARGDQELRRGVRTAEVKRNVNGRKRMVWASMDKEAERH